ncbi:MAG: flagellar basal body-associated FliL family protein, partial [Methylomonas sp.]|nr:flagellar basal body-associated FliL family protein [Methylomonas sp.]
YKPGSTEQSVSEGKQADKNGDQKVEVEPDVYYEISSPLMVNFPPGSSARIIKVAVTVLVQGEASFEILKKHEPMIRNNLLMIISSIGADSMKTLEGKQELQAKMLAEVGKVMEKMAGKNTVKDVYFTEFVMQ